MWLRGVGAAEGWWKFDCPEFSLSNPEGTVFFFCEAPMSDNLTTVGWELGQNKMYIYISTNASGGHFKQWEDNFYLSCKRWQTKTAKTTEEN